MINKNCFTEVTLYDDIYDDIATCSQIVAYNNTNLITKWIILVKDNLLYESGNYLEWDTWKFQLDSLNLPPGTEFTLLAKVQGDDSIQDITLIYQPNSATSYFELTGKIANTKLNYIATVDSPASPPVHPCSLLVLDNNSRMITKWSLINLDGSQIYLSGRKRMNSSVWLDLSSLNLAVGTEMLLKANCIGGADSIAYIIFKYIDDGSYFSKITLEGNAFKTVSMYQGTTI